MALELYDIRMTIYNEKEKEQVFKIIDNYNGANFRNICIDKNKPDEIINEINNESDIAFLLKMLRINITYLYQLFSDYDIYYEFDKTKMKTLRGAVDDDLISFSMAKVLSFKLQKYNKNNDFCFCFENIKDRDNALRIIDTLEKRRKKQ